MADRFPDVIYPPCPGAGSDSVVARVRQQQAVCPALAVLEPATSGSERRPYPPRLTWQGRRSEDLTDVRPAFQRGGQSLAGTRPGRTTGTGWTAQGRGRGSDLTVELNANGAQALRKQFHLVKRIFQHRVEVDGHDGQPGQCRNSPAIVIVPERVAVKERVVAAFSPMQRAHHRAGIPDDEDDAEVVQYLPPERKSQADAWVLPQPPLALVDVVESAQPTALPVATGIVFRRVDIVLPAERNTQEVNHPCDRRCAAAVHANDHDPSRHSGAVTFAHRQQHRPGPDPDRRAVVSGVAAARRRPAGGRTRRPGKGPWLRLAAIRARAGRAECR